jgi:hypothetical protein
VRIPKNCDVAKNEQPQKRAKWKDLKLPRTTPLPLQQQKRDDESLFIEIAEKDVRTTNLLKVKFRIDRENLLHRKIYIYEQRRQS